MIALINEHTEFYKNHSHRGTTLLRRCRRRQSSCTEYSSSGANP